MANMDLSWSQITSYETWQPLGSFSVQARLTDEIYQLGPHVFAKALRLGAESDVLHIGIFLWSPSAGAALRALARNIEADVACDSGVPPPVLLPVGAAATYGSILRAAVETRVDQVDEWASYRVGSDGAFVHRSIYWNRREYFFRSRRMRRSETPFAIAYKVGDATPSTDQGNS
jgi:hypothetical protein